MPFRARTRVRPSRIPTGGPVTVLAAALLAGLATMGGCAPDRNGAPGDAGGPTADPGVTAVRWPYWPRGMRVHPLSRLVRDEGRPRVLIEARVEFFDAEGDTTKAAGEIRIDLHEAASAPWDDSVADWSLDLRNRAVNRTHFDDITSTYLFRLEMPADQLPERPELRVYFLSADGAELRAELEIRTS